MAKFFPLLRVSFHGMLYAMNLSGGGKRKRRSSWALLGLATALMLFLSGTYNFSYGSILADVGAVDLLPVLMGMIAVLMCTMFTAMGAQGILFGTKDMDMALSWPVSPFALMLSRMTALYLENLFFIFAWMAPTFGAWLWFGGSGGPLSVVTLMLGILLLALVPTVLSLIAGYILAWLSSRFAYNALMGNLMYVLFLGAVVLMVVFLNGSLISPEGFLSGDTWWLKPVTWFTAGLLLDWLALGKLACISILPLLAITWLFSLQYVAILTRLASHRAKHTYRMKRQRSGKQFPALLRREAKGYFGTPIYVFNTLFGIVLLVIAAVAALIKRDLLLALLTSGDFTGMPVAAVLGAVIGFMLAMTSITSCSISLEGKYLWILRSAPVEVETVFKAKTLFQILVVLPAAVVCTALLAWSLGLPLVEGVLLTAAAGLLCLATAPAGLYVNLLFPKLDAPNATVVVKQSASVLLGLLVNFLFLVPGGLVAWLALDWLNGLGWLVVSCAVFLVLACVSWALLMTSGKRLFEGLGQS